MSTTRTSFLLEDLLRSDNLNFIQQEFKKSKLNRKSLRKEKRHNLHLLAIFPVHYGIRVKLPARDVLEAFIQDVEKQSMREICQKEYFRWSVMTCTFLDIGAFQYFCDILRQASTLIGIEYYAHIARTLGFFLDGLAQCYGSSGNWEEIIQKTKSIPSLEEILNPFEYSYYKLTFKNSDQNAANLSRYHVFVTIEILANFDQRIEADLKW
jgi:hypothetical protein